MIQRDEFGREFTIVNEGEGFVIAHGKARNFTYCDDKSPFGQRISIPTFYIFKPHEGHPLEVSHIGEGQINVWPHEERISDNPRMPARVEEDRISHDLATFMLVPYAVKDIGSKTKLFDTFEDGFRRKDGKGQPVSLLYVEHGMGISRQSTPYVSQVLPTQVTYHFWSWLVERKEIHSFKGSFQGQDYEGLISIPYDKARETLTRVTKTLEKRFDQSLRLDRETF